jgi:hypothetical protein
MATMSDKPTRDEIELLRDVRVAIKQIEAGKVISNREAKAELRRRFGRSIGGAGTAPLRPAGRRRD